jgi:hypothetical protein
MTDSQYRELLNQHQQLLNQQMQDRTAYKEYLKAQNAMMNSAMQAQLGSAMGQSAQTRFAPKSITVGQTTFHERDVKELHNFIEFMKFATEANEEMKALWTAFVVARKLEG